MKDLRKWWDKLCQIGPMYGYYPNANKTGIITKDDLVPLAREIFQGTGVKITSEGQRQLGAALGKASFRNSFMKEKVDVYLDK